MEKEWERLGWVTDIISVPVQLMEDWPASSGCQQSRAGEPTVVQNDLYPHPISHITSFAFILAIPSSIPSCHDESQKFHVKSQFLAVHF